MTGIPIYAPDCTDFSNNGLGLLLPTECSVERTLNGMFELTLVHPISDDLRWAQIQNGCVVKAATPERESPLFEISAFEGTEETTVTVTRAVYKVKTRGSRLNLRVKPNTSSKILGSYKPGTEVVKLADAGSASGHSWFQVSISNGGATGYMAATYLEFSRNIAQTMTTTQPVTREGMTVQPAREQLFRIYSVETDTEAGTVTAQAMHIFYDLLGNIIGEDYNPENVNVATVAGHIFDAALNDCDFTLHTGRITGTISGEYGYKNIPEALLDPDEGVASKAGALLIPDNFDVFLLPDQVRDMGVTVRRGKNLVGVTVTHDMSGVVTRIVPVGRNKDGDPLYLDGAKYIDSSRIGDYPTIFAQKIDYDVSVGDGEGQFSTDAAARAELRKRVKADYDSGVDLPTYGMDVDFILLGDAAGYENYASLQSVHLADTVTVIDELIGLNAKVRMTGYKWDVLGEQYESVTLGELQSLERTVYSYNISSVSGNKLVPNSVSGYMMRDATINYAKISVAAIEQLSAKAITALRAHINELVAGSVTTDQLYADLAAIAVAQITSANIDKANINWAEIKTLSTEMAEIAKANINTANIKSANIDWAEINALSTVIADIAVARISEATISTAQIAELDVAIADIANAKIEAADIGFGQIKDLTAGTAIITQGVGGRLYINRLAVTEANMVSLSVGELIIKGSDGGFYALGVDADGNITTTLKQVGNSDVADLSINAGEKIIEGTITAATLNAKDIFVDSAIIRQLIAANLEVDTLWNREAWMSKINGLGGSLDLSANKSIQLLVGDLNNKKSSVFRQDAMPEEASDGDLWVQPSTGRTWQYSEGAAGAPSFALSDDGQLAYAYASGQTAYALQIGEDGWLSIDADAPFWLDPDDAGGVWMLVVDVDEINGRLGETESSIIQTKDEIALTVRELGALEDRVSSAELALRPGQIAAVVRQEISVGGRNLALDTGDEQSANLSTAAAMGPYWILSDYGKEALDAVGTDFVVSFEAKASVAGAPISVRLRQNTSSVITSPASQTISLTTGYTRYTFASATSAAGSARVWFLIGASDLTGSVSIKNVKVELGNMATGWSPAPEDPGQALDTYSGVYINKDEVHLVSPKTTIAVPSDNGEDDVARFDADGVHAQIVEADEIISPSVVSTQPAASFAPANAGELAAIAENLKNVCLTGSVTINTSALTGGTLALQGLSGGPALTVSGGTLNGAELTGCSARINFSNVTFSTSGTAIAAAACERVALKNCVLNAGTGVLATEGSNVRMSGCTGACDCTADSRDFSAVVVLGAAPGTDIPYGLEAHSTGGQVYAGARLTAKPTAEPEPDKPTIQSATLTPTLTRTWNGSWRDEYYLWQGRYGSLGLNRGCMWFDTSAFAGKTILSATLSLKRMSRAGSGAAVSIKICGTTATGASGTPAIGTQYASVGIAPGARKSVDVTAAAQALANGTIKGLMLYDSSTSNLSSSNNWTACYAKLYGYDTGDRPVLTITWEG